jgi:hypothetical protein
MTGGSRRRVDHQLSDVAHLGSRHNQAPNWNSEASWQRDCRIGRDKSRKHMGLRGHPVQAQKRPGAASLFS